MDFQLFIVLAWLSRLVTEFGRSKLSFYAVAMLIVRIRLGSPPSVYSVAIFRSAVSRLLSVYDSS